MSIENITAYKDKNGNTLSIGDRCKYPTTFGADRYFKVVDRETIKWEHKTVISTRLIDWSKCCERVDR
jgi:hypothetical protein